VTRTSSGRLWIVQIVPELPRWTLVTESINDPDELSVIPVRFDTRNAAIAALNDSRQRRIILEDFERSR
jgi:hypothetical protein